MTPLEQAEADLDDAKEDFGHRARTVQRELDYDGGRLVRAR